MRDRLPPRHSKDALSRRAVTRLGFAVRLVDAVTGDRPSATPPIRTDRFGKPSATNRRGFHLFLERPDADPSAGPATDEFTLTVGPHPFYRPEQVTVRVSDEPPAADEEVRVVAPSAPALELTLLPTTAYPVQPWQTVVRGRVTGPPPTPGGERPPVADATLSFDGLASVGGVDYTARSTDTGEFLLCVPPAENVTVATVEGVPRVRVDDADPVLVVDHPDLVAANDPEQQPVTTGRTTRWDVPLTSS